ncbi:hypothetical protein D8770_24990 [Methylobacterium sp. DB1607]|nr:hypothetical protein [Methylobacterium sp. DB1607]
MVRDGIAGDSSAYDPLKRDGFIVLIGARCIAANTATNLASSIPAMTTVCVRDMSFSLQP